MWVFDVIFIFDLLGDKRHSSYGVIQKLINLIPRGTESTCNIFLIE